MADISLKQLEVFLAVADAGSFSRGAEQCCLTQSTVSQHVSALEKSFGARLFDRTGKGALLTEAGKLLHDHAREVVVTVRRTERALVKYKGLDGVTLRVGGSTVAGTYLIPRAITPLITRHPTLLLDIVQADSSDIVQRVLDEEIELGIVGNRYDEEALSFTPLFDDEIVLITPADHPLAARKKIAVEDLAGQDILMREPGSGTGKAVLEALAAAGFPVAALRPRAILGSSEGIKTAVMGGGGIAFISSLSVEKELQRGDLATVTVKDLSIRRRFYLIGRNGREISPAAAAFAEVIAQLFPGNH